jgi:diguanylate cyclase (GGDEF)-like protein
VLGLDRFSEVNETLGHDNGDTVLREVADRLRRAIDGTTVARLGGDEFAVLTPPAVNDTDLRALGDQLVAAVTPRITIDGLHLEAGMSIGVALAPDHANDAESLLRCADTAMRQAKGRRSGFEVHAGGGETDTRRRLALAHQLRQAIDERELTVYYQPKIDMTSGWSVGVEALVRWNHPQLGFLPPDEFIPIAEHTGFIEPLTALVLDAALAQRRTWADAGLELGVAVNVSARSLADRALADRVTRALLRNRCPSDSLTIEITETQLMADPARAAVALRELHDLGVRISIDDFGTGFSSLSSLRALPIDEVKIDKSFVLGVMQNESDAAIVRSIAALGRSLGLHVTAEGVEDADTLQFVTACGAHTAQGYFFTVPLPPDQLEAWMRKRIAADIHS